MRWLKAWMQAMTGPPRSEPWDDDPQIAAERRGQHDRINRSMSETIQQRRREQRIRAMEEAWRRGHD
jgi:hypothetical protein